MAADRAKYDEARKARKELEESTPLIVRQDKTHPQHATFWNRWNALVELEDANAHPDYDPLAWSSSFEKPFNGSSAGE
jgi:hypothetical protein